MLGSKDLVVTVIVTVAVSVSVVDPVEGVIDVLAVELLDLCVAEVPRNGR